MEGATLEYLASWIHTQIHRAGVKSWMGVLRYHYHLSVIEILQFLIRYHTIYCQTWMTT